MAHEENKAFNAMLHDSKDMPKFQTITDEKSIERYGGSRMCFAPPIDYDTVMKRVFGICKHDSVTKAGVQNITPAFFIR